MDSASDEINLLLPLAFGLILVLFLAVLGLIFWLLFRFKVVEISNKTHLIEVLRSAFLSLSGVLAISAIIGGFVFVLNIVINFFKK